MSAAPQTVTFPSSDGLPITADVFLCDQNDPFLLLFHQARSSRGEYREIAPRLVGLGYNCLAADLRSGDEMQSVRNETALRARQKGLPTAYLDAEQDLLATIDYVRAQHKKSHVVLLGSSYSASLVLKVAATEASVRAAVAFSPGEYMRPALNLQQVLKGLDKPVFVTATPSELPAARELLAQAAKTSVTWYEPKIAPGTHGARALWQASTESDATWTALASFLSQSAG